MFENQLIVGAGFQNQREFIKALNPAQQLGAVDQINRYRRFLATREIEKTILNVLW